MEKEVKSERRKKGNDTEKEVRREGKRQERQATCRRIGQGLPEAGMLLASTGPRRIHPGRWIPDALSKAQAGLALRKQGDQGMPGEVLSYVERRDHMRAIVSQVHRLVSHCVLCFRPFPWFFRRNWYALRWGIPGVDSIGKLWLVDVGAITLGWRDAWNARMRRNETANAEAHVAGIERQGVK